jgi:hypothetical protein
MEGTASYVTVSSKALCVIVAYRKFKKKMGGDIFMEYVFVWIEEIRHLGLVKRYIKMEAPLE